MSKDFGRYTLTLVMIVAWAAVILSLYYGYFGDPVANLHAGDFFNHANALEPCELCWYQRTMMYPIAVISSLALVKKKKDAWSYILPLSLIGLVIAIYHVYIQQTPANPFLPCNPENPCTEVQLQYFGFLTIPIMSLFGFVAINILFLIDKYVVNSNDKSVAKVKGEN